MNITGEITVTRLKQFIDFHLSEIRSSTDIQCNSINSNESLEGKFYAAERVPLNEYIMERKVEAMKEFLLISSEPYRVVCSSVGLHEEAGMDVFKNIAGQTMQEYRQKNVR